MVFAGYGITVSESQDFGYDSYFGLDVEDKFVLVLRYFPEDASAEVKTVLARYSGLRYKALNARERGAKGLLLVTGPRSPNAGELVPLNFDSAAAGSGIVAASINGDVAAKLFEDVADKTLEQAQADLDTANPHVGGFAIPDVTLGLNVQLERKTGTGYNVAGYFPPSEDEGDAGAFVLLGAHYDHLGQGRQGNSLAGKDETGETHSGADDNASGVAAVLAAVERLKTRKRKASIAFAFWSGEEMGLLGSGAFVAAKVIAPEALIAYVNYDMVGPMRDNKLVLQAIGTSSIWPRLIEQTNVPVGFDIQASDDPYLPTDVTSFNQAEVPSINFFTGSHKEYHRPADRAELINFEDLERVAQFGAILTEKLANLDERPVFVKVTRTQQEGGSRDTVRAFTGTIPDYSTEVQGLLLSGVIEGGPAEEAGLQGGDASGTSLVDLVGEAPSKRRALDGEARSKGATIVPGCGVAPGISNFCVGRGMELLDETDRAVIYVGGIPREPRPPLYYETVYLLESVFGAYRRPATIRLGGEPVEVEPLTGLEEIEFPVPIGVLETFYTDGLGSLAMTVGDRVRDDLYEKTLRYRGHVAAIQLLQACGLFERRPVDVFGTSVPPVVFLQKVLEDRLKLGPASDILVLSVLVQGRKDGEPRAHTFELIDFFDPATGNTAMACTAGFTAACAARRIASGSIATRGVLFPEEIFLGDRYDAIVSELADKGVTITHRVGW